MKRTTDMTDVEAFLREGTAEVRALMERVGREAVDYARVHGNYRDHTGTLRRSTEYDTTPYRLTIRNTAPYASYVEAKGYDVISGATLYALNRLREEAGK